MVAILAAAALVLHVDLRADRTLPCAAHAALLETLQRQPRVHLGPAQAELDFQAGSWQLLLRRAGRVLLRRTLPPSDCALLAETAALIIDRYFSQVRAPLPPRRPRRIAGPIALAEPPQRAQVPSPPSDPPASTVDTGSDLMPGRAVLIPSVAAAIYEATEPQRAPDLMVSVGLAALDDLRPGLWLQAERRWRSGSASFLLVAGGADHDQGPVRESALQSALMALSVGPCFESFVRGCFAPFAGVRGGMGGDQHTLRPSTTLRLVPELGAMVSLDRTVLRGVNVGLSILVGRPLGESAFDPADPPQELDYAVALRAGLAF